MSNYVYGIDPGTTHSALVVLSPTFGESISRFKISYIYEGNHKIKNLIHSFAIGHLFIEMMNFQGRFGVGQETLDCCREIGRFYEASRVPVTLILRRDILLYYCNTSRADDGDVAQVLRDRIGPKGTKKAPGPTYGIASHGWQALAVGWMGMELLDQGRLKLEDINVRQYNGKK